nr:hypothetical protein CFP56_18426 [Quercus suber]
MAGRSTDSETIIISQCDVALRNHGSFNSNATGSWRFTIQLKVLLLKAFYGLWNSCNAALDLAIKLKDSIWEAIYHRLNSDEARVFFEAFHGLLVFLTSFPTALIGLHFQVLGVSPLDTHFAIVLLFIMATIIYGIAYVEIKMLPQDDEYLPILRGTAPFIPTNLYMTGSYRNSNKQLLKHFFQENRKTMVFRWKKFLSDLLL